MADIEQTQKILVVDDDKIIRLLLSEVLADLGSVELAESGDEAFGKIADTKPDLIILDVQMPEMDGYEVCQRLKADEQTADIPVVFITANNSNEDEERGLDIGATDFIRKPISAKIVRTRTSNILKLRAATRELELLASTDPLTNAYNRRFFQETGNAELHRSKRYHLPFTVLMLDIDHFKSVNDTYGHNIGDEALKETVRVIDGVLRQEDTLGRLGGEEFAAILPQTAKDAAMRVAERIRSAIAEIVIETPNGPLTFTMSIGVTETDDADDDLDAALSRADEALYVAKEQGRNRVVST